MDSFPSAGNPWIPCSSASPVHRKSPEPESHPGQPDLLLGPLCGFCSTSSRAPWQKDRGVGDTFRIYSSRNHTAKYLQIIQHMEFKKSPSWKGKLSSKPPCLGSILIFQGVHTLHIQKKHDACSVPKIFVRPKSRWNKILFISTEGLIFTVTNPCFLFLVGSI